MPLDLLVPDLLSPSPASPRLRFLEKWLARADVEREGAGWLARAFGLSELPVAALERGEGRTWMRADPVHLRVQGDELHLYDAAKLDIAPPEARELVAALQSHFAADGLEFDAPSADRWYVRIPSGEAPRTTPLSDAIGRNVFGLLPAQAKWRSAMTEAQMILSGHEVNARRESQGKLAINSVWFWGAGEMPVAVTKPYAAIYADDALYRGLAKWSGAQYHLAPAGIATLELPRERDAILAVVPASASIDESWFAPLASAIERFDLVRIVLPSGGSTLVATLTGSARWRWFRTSKPLAAYA